MENKTRGFEYISSKNWESVVQNASMPYAPLPKRSTAKSAGYDFFSPFNITLKTGESKTIPTSIKAYMLDDEYLEIVPRSGLGFKYFARLANTVGIIDSDYYDNDKNEGHIFIKIRNEGVDILEIKEQQGFAQGIFKKYLMADGDTFDGSIREGGMGSTDK